MAKPDNNLTRSMLLAVRGIIYTVRTQRNMQIHLAIAFIVIVLGVMLRIDCMRWVAIMLAISLVIVAELINTAIEVNVDLVTKKMRPRAAMAKDVAAGAVFFAAIGAVVIGMLVFGSSISKLIGV